MGALGGRVQELLYADTQYSGRLQPDDLGVHRAEFQLPFACSVTQVVFERAATYIVNDKYSASVSTSVESRRGVDNPRSFVHRSLSVLRILCPTSGEPVASYGVQME